MDASNIKNYLECWKNISNNSAISGNKWYDFSNYILDNGIEFKNVNKETDFYLTKRAVKKECYKNSLLACIHNKNLRYVEGFYDADGLALPHAWTIDEDEFVNDFTAVNNKIDVSGYLGIIVPKKVLNDFILKNKKDFITPLQYYFEQYLNKVPCQKSIN